MKKPRLANRNAVTHGLFAVADARFASTAFGELARSLELEWPQKEHASAIEAAESHALLCKTAVSTHLHTIDVWLSSDTVISPDALKRSLSRLGCLLRYELDSISTVRKRRIALLNEAEGIVLVHRPRRRKRR